MISRRQLLELAGVSAVAAACGETDVQSFPGLSALAPWHMWGGSLVLDASNTATEFASGQLARINYARPETWDFLFGVRILDAPVVAAGVVPLINVAFDLFAGVGRSVLEIVDQFAGVTGFANFDFTWAIAAPAPIGRLKWTSAVLAPAMHDTFATPDTPRIDQFVAQDIQCRVRAGFAGGAGPLAVKLDCYAGFAPRAHVRPEWFRGGAYRGSEQGGT